MTIVSSAFLENMAGTGYMGGAVGALAINVRHLTLTLVGSEISDNSATICAALRVSRDNNKLRCAETQEIWTQQSPPLHTDE